MRVTLLPAGTTMDGLRHIGEMASICYDSDTSPEACVRRALKCKDSGHLATLRFAYATFNVSGISRVCSHQLVRMAHAGILQRCVTGDTKIAVINNESTGDIKWMPISRMYELQNGARGSHNWKGRVRVYDEDTGLFTVAKVKEVFFNGVKPVFKVKTEGDLSITCTLNHKLFTQRGFVELGELQVGDYVARNGEYLYKNKEWLLSAKIECMNDGTGLAGIAEKSGVSTHTVRKWLKKHGIQFTKKEVSSYTPAWNKGLYGEDVPWYGRKADDGERARVSSAKIGDKNPAWGGGVTEARKVIANRTGSNRMLRERVFAKFGNKCYVCGSTSDLELDHIEPVRERPDLAYDEINMQCLCKVCHSEKSIAESNRLRKTVRWVQITSIEPAGDAPTYDLEVDHKSHNYVANKLVVHNSQRYVKETSVEYVDPPALAHCSYDDQLEWASIQDRAEALYLKLVDTKAMRKEDARYILPQGCTTGMNLCLNFQGWRDFLRNRNDTHAQWEVRAVAAEINRQLGEIAPGLFGVTR